MFEMKLFYLETWDLLYYSDWLVQKVNCLFFFQNLRLVTCCGTVLTRFIISVRDVKFRLERTAEGIHFIQ